MSVNDFGMPSGFEAIPMMDSQDFQAGDIVEVIETGERGRISSIAIDPSLEGCLSIRINGSGDGVAANELRRVR